MLGVVVIFGGLFIGGLVLGNATFQKQAKQLIDLKLEDQLIKEQQTALIQASKDIEKYADLEKIAKTVVPQDKDQAKAVREINTIAAASGIQIESITFPTSTLGQNTAPEAKPADGSTPKQTTPSITQVKPVEGISGVFSLEITVKPKGNQSFGQFIDFMERLEKNRRTAQISKFSIQPSGNLLSFDVTLNVYIKP
jgi:hypothetical protein